MKSRKESRPRQHTLIRGRQLAGSLQPKCTERQALAGELCVTGGAVPRFELRVPTRGPVALALRPGGRSVRDCGPDRPRLWPGTLHKSAPDVWVVYARARGSSRPQQSPPSRRRKLSLRRRGGRDGRGGPGRGGRGGPGRGSLSPVGNLGSRDPSPGDRDAWGVWPTGALPRPLHPTPSFSVAASRCSRPHDRQPWVQRRPDAYDPPADW